MSEQTKLELRVPVEHDLMMRFVFLAMLSLVAAVFAEDYPGAPASVTAAYLEADGEGAALDTKKVPGLLRYTTWTSVKETNPVTVIKSYDIGEVSWDADKASVQIIYHVAGELRGFTFIAKPSDETVDFDLIKTGGKWKLVKPQLPPHLFIDSAFETLKSNPGKLAARSKAMEELRALAAEAKSSTTPPLAPNAMTEAKLKSTKIPLVDFDAISFREALEFLKHSSVRVSADPPANRGFGIVFKGGASEPLGVPQPKTEPRITLHAKDISFEEALQSITTQAGLQYRIENGEVQIFPASALPEK